MKKQLTKKDLEEIIGGKMPELKNDEYFVIIAACFFVVSINNGNYQRAKDVYNKIKEHGDEKLFSAFKAMIECFGVNINDYVNK